VKFAVSNIAWPREQDEAMVRVLHEHGVAGIEIAPTKLWPQPLQASDSDIDAVRRFWADRGLAIVAAQALLFGKPELTIFESAATRAAALEYLGGIVRLCAKLGAGALVFGSPKNRRVGALPVDEAMRIAVEFFTRLGEAAANAGTCIVMEANPPVYGADFITRAADAIEIVERVNHPGFRLHIDTGCMTLAGDSIEETFARSRKWMKHFHVSEPNLDPPGTSGRVDHAAFAAALRDYTGWISLEMREVLPFDLAAVTQSVRWLKSNYGQSVN
jgi:sugar phosphate isomerase/epimerase